MSGRSRAAKPLSSSSAPMPCGPSRPLCPGTASADSRKRSKSTGMCPAVCAASRAKGIPYSLHIFPTASASCTVPQTLEAWAITTSLVLGLMSPRSSSGSILPLPSQGTRSKLTPSFSSCTSGRMTALCSIEETMQWSPGRSRPFMTMLSPAVAPGVMTACVASGLLKMRQSRSRSVSVTSPAAWAEA